MLGRRPGSLGHHATGHLVPQELAARERQLKEQNEELRASRYNRTLIEASLDPPPPLMPRAR